MSTPETCWLVSVTTGGYSSQSWYAVRTFTDKCEAQAFVAEAERVQEALIAQGEKGPHPLFPKIDVNPGAWGPPEWTAQEVSLNGLWRQLVPAGAAP